MKNPLAMEYAITTRVRRWPVMEDGSIDTTRPVIVNHNLISWDENYPAQALIRGAATRLRYLSTVSQEELSESLGAGVFKIEHPPTLDIRRRLARTALLNGDGRAIESYQAALVSSDPEGPVIERNY